MLIYLARHGNTFQPDEPARWVGARTDLPLTKTGLNQAEAVATFLANQPTPPTFIYSGPLTRQVTMASIVQKALPTSPEVVVTEALNELDYGLWENKTNEEIDLTWKDEQAAWSKQGVWPKGIFATEAEVFTQRLQSWLDTLVRTHAQDDVCFAVTSNGPLRTLRTRIDGSLEGKVKTGHLCLIEYTDSRFILREWNINPTV